MTTPAAKKAPYLREVESAKPLEDERAAEDMARVERTLRRVQKAGFYGRVVFGFLPGRFSSATLEQTVKPEDL